MKAFIALLALATAACSAETVREPEPPGGEPTSGSYDVPETGTQHYVCGNFEYLFWERTRLRGEFDLDIPVGSFNPTYVDNDYLVIPLAPNTPYQMLISLPFNPVFTIETAASFGTLPEGHLFEQCPEYFEDPENRLAPLAQLPANGDIYHFFVTPEVPGSDLFLRIDLLTFGLSGSYGLWTVDVERL